MMILKMTYPLCQAEVLELRALKDLQHLNFFRLAQVLDEMAHGSVRTVREDHRNGENKAPYLGTIPTSLLDVSK